MRPADTPGTVIVNRVTGERGTVVVSAAMTGGEYLRAELVAVPGGHVAGEHFHPHQEERFEVLEGELTYKLDGTQGVARAGETLIIPQGSVHDWWNASGEPARALVEVRPARNFEAMITAIWGLANEGRTNSRGMPGPLQLAVIAEAYAEDVVFTSPPPWVQRLMIRILAPIGRALGRKAHDPRWEDLIIESIPEPAVGQT
jgi:quercetin dioxygenase-like cupin family protein